MSILNRFLILFIFLLTTQLFSQSSIDIDSLKRVINNKQTTDTTRVLAMDQLSLKLVGSNLDLALDYANKGLKLANQIDFDKGKVRLLNRLAYIYTRTNNFSISLKTAYEAIDLAKKIDDQEGLGKIYNNLSIFYSIQTNYKKAIEYDRMVYQIARKLNNNSLAESALLSMGADFISLEQIDSAKYYLEKVYKVQQSDSKSNYQYMTLQSLGSVHFIQKDYEKAIKIYKICIEKFEKINDLISLGQTSLNLANVYKAINKQDSSIYFAKKAYDLAVKMKVIKLEFEAAKLLSEVYEKSNTNEAFRYFKISVAAKDSLFNAEKINQLHAIELQEKIRLEQIAESEREYNSKLRFGLLIGLLAALLILAIVQYRNNLQKNRINEELQKQKVETEQQKDQLHESLETLKRTQKQLILRDKLASLGELTAGIAHEIQNPLNFVNNFSEINTELIQEVLAEREKTTENRNHNGEKEILNDVLANQNKILHHGKRASSIVSTMLEHSRNSTGKKDQVKLPELIEEFLKLSYLSIKAKYKDFNPEYAYIPDGEIPQILGVSQDLGRVFLNLFNNSFYALHEKQQQLKNPNYKPKLIVSSELKYETENSIAYVQITVTDNGIGIKNEIKDKILQPFFTTKPTGEGTGLGLSLCYDIIAKGHNGTLDLESDIGEGAKFVITLPLS